MRTIAISDNCVDVYYKLGVFYATGNSIDFAINYKKCGGDITEMTVLGSDSFAEAVEEQLKKYGVDLIVMDRVDKPTAVAQMDIINGDRVHVKFSGNALNDITFTSKDIEKLKEFDIIYSERWAKLKDFIKEIAGDGRIIVYDFSKRLDNEDNDKIIPYLDYAFFSYEHNDEYIREYIKNMHGKGAKVAIAMLGKDGSLAYDGKRYYQETAEEVKVVNTVGAGDSYIAAFMYGVSLGESIPQCMKRGKTLATEIVQQFNPY
jgi:fructoselysine 6-kinase